jgi:glutathione reductase (NADPH)
MTAFDHDLLVIGAGSGGVRAARVAAAHGARVAVAEEYRVGGTCVIRGCVPKKLLVYGAHFAEDLRDARHFGWRIPEEGPGSPRFDWATLRDRVLGEVDRLCGLYQQTLDRHQVTLLPQRARLVGPHEVALADGRVVSAKVILLATGARPVVPDVPGAERGITSNEVFHLPQCPRRVVIGGGGYIANEFAGIFHEFGAQVTVVNRSDEILRGYDASIRDRLLQISLGKGIQFRFNAPFERIEKRDDGTLRVHLGDGNPPIDCDLLLFATGRQPNTEGLGLEALGVALGRHGAVQVNAESRTSVDSLYAVGDVTDRVQLTPVAIREGQAFADSVFGGQPWTVDHSCIPSAVFSHPPLAGVGLTEAQAREQFGDIQVFTADFRPMKNVLAQRNERALYKMVVDAATQRVVGLHMIGPDAPEILQAAAIAVKAGLTKHQFDQTVALHPSMAEELVLLK